MTTREARLPARLLTVTLGIGLALASAHARPALADTVDSRSARDIVAASVAASGGKALDAVRSVRRRADMHIEGAFGVLDGKWEIAFVPGSKGLQTDDFGTGTTSIGWNGTVGWEETAMGLRELNAEEIALNRWLWELSFLHALARDARTGSLERLDDETIDGTLHPVLEYTDERGIATRIYVDPETSLVSRLASSIDIPTIGHCAVTTDYSDYADFGGVMLPQASSQVIEGLWSYRARFTSTELDPELPATLFERPDARR